MTCSRSCALGPAGPQPAYGRVIAALARRGRRPTRPSPQQYRARFVEPRRDQARAILRRAIDAASPGRTTNIEVALDLLYGPLYHRLLHGHAPLNERFVRDVIDTALDGIAPSRAAGRAGQHADDQPSAAGDAGR